MNEKEKCVGLADNITRTHISTLLYLSPLSDCPSVRPSVRLSSGEDVAMMAARVRRRVLLLSPPPPTAFSH